MRNLTIKRNKTFVASLVKTKVYIEDNVNNDIIINNVPCRLLGSLKNGEEKTFQIDDAQAKVFVIVDKLSKNYCNDFYQLNDGCEDIYLSGQNKLNSAGNAFRFDNNTNAEAIKNQKKGKRTGLTVIIVSAIIGAIIGSSFSFGLFDTAPVEKQFADEGICITLTDKFEKVDPQEPFNLIYASPDVAVFCLKEEFTIEQGIENYSIDDYAKLVMKNNGISDAQVIKENGLNYFRFENANGYDNSLYAYYTYMFKSDDAFWLVQFTTKADNEEIYKDDIHTWASSINFD